MVVHVCVCHVLVQDALLAHENAVALEPNDAVIINNYGYALELLGQYKDALAVSYLQLLTLCLYPVLLRSCHRLRCRGSCCVCVRICICI